MTRVYVITCLELWYLIIHLLTPSIPFRYIPLSPQTVCWECVVYICSTQIQCPSVLSHARHTKYTREVHSPNGLILITGISLSAQLFQSSNVRVGWYQRSTYLRRPSAVSLLSSLYDQRRFGGLAAALKQHAVFTNDHRRQCQWGRAAVRTAMCTPHTHTTPVRCCCDSVAAVLRCFFTDAEGWRDRSLRRSVSREL